MNAYRITLLQVGGNETIVMDVIAHNMRRARLIAVSSQPRACTVTRAELFRGVEPGRSGSVNVIRALPTNEDDPGPRYA